MLDAGDNWTHDIAISDTRNISLYPLETNLMQADFYNNILFGNTNCPNKRYTFSTTLYFN